MNAAVTRAPGRMEEFPRQGANPKATWPSTSPDMPRQFKASRSRGNANLSNRTKRKENRYAGHNDDKWIIVAATGGCDEWTVAWG
jgi:hypothetical protein